MNTTDHDDGCPGPVKCPLYIIAHDPRISHLGCVRDLAEPCDGSASPERFHALLDRAQDKIVAGLRARLGVDRELRETQESSND